MDLQLKSLRVHRIPGVADGGFELSSLSPGVNVLYGPNGIGKSVTSRALVATLWPETATADTHVSAEITDSDRATENGSFWKIVVNGNRAVTEIDGMTVGPLVSLPREFADRYRLSLHDLIYINDKDLAKAVAKEAAGGYEVARVVGALGFNEGMGTRSALQNAYRGAKEQVDQIVRQQAELLRSENDLDRLRKDLEETRRRARSADSLERTIDFLEGQKKEKHAFIKLSQYPDNMDRLLATDGEQLTELTDKAKKLREASRGRRESLKQARRRRLTAHVPAEGRSDEKLAVLREEVSALKEREGEVRNAEASVESARRRLSTWVAEFSGHTPNLTRDILDRSESAPMFTLDSIRSVNAYAQKVEQIHAQRKALESFQYYFADSSQASEHEQVSLRNGINLLNEWLATPPLQLEPPGEKPADAASHIAYGKVFLLIGAGSLVVESLMSGLPTHPAYIIFVVVAIVLVVAAFLRPRQAPAAAEATMPPTDRRALTAERYIRLALADSVPAVWNPDTVEIVRDDLVKKLASDSALTEKAVHWRGKESDVKRLDEEEAALAAERDHLAATLGIDSSVLSDEPTLFYTLCSKALKVVDETTQVAEENGRAAEMRRACGQQLSRVNDMLATYDIETVTTAAEATAIADLIRGRLRSLEAAQNEIDALFRERRIQAIPAMRECKKRYRALFDRLGLPVGDEPAVHRCLECQKAYREDAEALRVARTALQYARDRLKDVPQEIRETAESELREQLAEANAATGEIEEKSQAITRIETNIKNARGSSSLEKAIDALERSKDGLREDRAMKSAHCLGSLVCDYVQDESRAASTPPVLTEARKILATVTRGRYELTFTPGPDPAFQVKDTVEGEMRELSELSSGTRVQLLLAVRIAFIKQQEQGHCLPLLLDETLANSDSDRMTAVIEAVLQMVKEGRQVFYFTARQDEVCHWRDAAEKDGVPLVIIDLAERRRQLPSWSNSATVTVPPDRLLIPDPDKLTPIEYGRVLGVMPLDPDRFSDAIPIFYPLMHDLPRLRRILQTGISTVGQWQVLNSVAQGKFVFAAGNAADDKAWIKVVDAFCGGLRKGRPKSITRDLLSDAGISATFIDRIWEIAEEENHDGKRLLDIITAGADDRTARFRKDTLSKMREVFADAGCLPEEERLDLAGLRAHVLNEMSAESLPAEDIAHRVDDLYYLCQANQAR